MKIKIVFCEPPYEAMRTNQKCNNEEKIIFIKDPYNISMIDWGRSIIREDESKVTYEHYCVELKKIIDDTIEQNLQDVEVIDGITIDGCKEPPNFEALHSSLAKANLSIANKCTIIYKDCFFGGSLFVNSVINFVKTANKKNNAFFNITLDEEANKNKSSKLSHHDKAKLAAIKNVAFFLDQESPPLLRTFADDQTLVSTPQFKLNRMKAKYDDDPYPREPLFRTQSLLNPTYFFRGQLNNKSSSERLLMSFFSQYYQQRSDYTCGPAAIKMVADYYTTLGKRYFCGEPISDYQTALKFLNSSNEFELAEQVLTTEEVGSDIEDMRKGLMGLGLTILDDCSGLSPNDKTKRELKKHKEVLWDKIKEVLKLGVPVIINLRDREEIGHYEVAIGIDAKQNIIFAEPGTALSGTVEFESIPKEQFIGRWRNNSGERHGCYLIIPPNEASAHKIDAILQGIPHYFNGELKGGEFKMN